jgi:hypothetical protein
VQMGSLLATGYHLPSDIWTWCVTGQYSNRLLSQLGSMDVLHLADTHQDLAIVKAESGFLQNQELTFTTTRPDNPRSDSHREASVLDPSVSMFLASHRMPLKMESETDQSCYPSRLWQPSEFEYPSAASTTGTSFPSFRDISGDFQHPGDTRTTRREPGSRSMHPAFYPLTHDAVNQHEAPGARHWVQDKPADPGRHRQKHRRLLPKDNPEPPHAPRSSPKLSRQTRHRLQEKKRRDRLTDAIRRLETLLPVERVGGAVEPQTDAREADVVTRAGTQRANLEHNSKLAVIQLAIRYIEALQLYGPHESKSDGSAVLRADSALEVDSLLSDGETDTIAQFDGASGQ